MTVISSTRPHQEWTPQLGLETEDIVVVPGATSAVASPCSPQTNAMARFEFETGHGSSDGTKILMVEWEAPTESAHANNTWNIEWDGKTAFFPAWDTRDSTDGLLRVYILLPPGASIPPLVNITRIDAPKSAKSAARTATVASTPGVPAMITPVSATSPSAAAVAAAAAAAATTAASVVTVDSVVHFTAKPLPAIFAAGLGNKSIEAGKRGVLHTIWAKLRLAALHAEMDDERRKNSESIGLEMAMQEYRWLAAHFGLPQLAEVKVATEAETEAEAAETEGAKKATQTSPASLSPGAKAGGNRLTEKLKGLKLATSPADLNSPPSLRSTIMQGRAMSPATTVDVGGALSLDSVLTSGALPPGADKNEDELFALPMSPRSPEMKRSPFSMLS